MLDNLIAQRFSERFSLLSDVSQRIISILELDDLLTQVSRLIQQSFKYYHVGIGLIEEGDVVYRVGAGPLWDDPAFEFKPAQLKVGNEGVTGWVAGSGIPALLPDVHSDSRYIWMQGSQTKSELTVPIIFKGTVIGVLDVQSDHLNGFDETDLDFMQMLANQTGVAIENARLFAETQRLLKESERRANKLTIINSVQQVLASKFDVQSIYELVGEKFRDIFDAQVVVISTYDERSNTVEHRYAIERGVRIPWPGTYPPGGFRSQIVQTRQPLLLNTNVAEEANRMGQPILQGTETPRSWLGVPVLVDDQVIGILSIQNLDCENAFDEYDIRLLQIFAASMSIALENASLLAQARQLAVLEERQRLGRELHDSVTQSLYGISLYAQAATGKININELEQAMQYLEDIQNTAQESLADMRLLIYELKPPILEREGLISALQHRLHSVEDRANIKSRIENNLKARPPSEVEEGLYLIAREALNNIIKHAHAKNISIILGGGVDSVTMKIYDDGNGFDREHASREGCLGLSIMQERARSQGWNLDISSSPGNGTQVRVEVKLQ